MSHSDYKVLEEGGDYATEQQPLSDIEDMEEDIKPKSAMPRRGSKCKSVRVKDPVVSQERNFSCDTCPKTFTTNRSRHNVIFFLQIPIWQIKFAFVAWQKYTQSTYYAQQGPYKTNNVRSALRLRNKYTIYVFINVKIL